MSNREIISSTYEKHGGIFRLIPIFVPRPFSTPGRRLRLHPDDYYAFGTERGAIKERWFSSVIHCNNGPLTRPDEGLSYVSYGTTPEEKFTRKEPVEKLGAKLSQDGRTVRLQGAEPLHAARLHAGDLRGGAALVLGAMQAEGESTIFGVKHIQRGYDNLEAALQSAGARLKTVEIPIKV